ncbi:hypothetical protein [uncultured Microbulbifer sp.]|uniref:hypothetical protein n=1 Tax=uncultured Microbulbifer sp. TaxID=348147 RepID=UPI002637FCC8|nr:hypothetical protein [uncultured Microbulbifer sp.]
MKKIMVTYVGAMSHVSVFGCRFAKGEPLRLVDQIAQDQIDRMKNNRFFKVEERELKPVRPPNPPADEKGEESATEDPLYPFPTDSKDALQDWAQEHLGLDLDKRKGLGSLIEQVNAAHLEAASGGG